jgi:FKBP-type peptidyl-prolyl cis-trans isomerase 2
VNIKVSLPIALAVGLFLLTALSWADEPVIEEGRQVALEYTLTLDDGSLADSNIGEEPYVYVHGRQEILPGLEAALVGMSAGEERVVRLSPEEGYGPVDPQAFQEVPLEAIPEEGRQVGEMLIGADPTGQPFQVRVAEVREEDEVVVVDFNHPLAGQALNFAVKVLAVN